MKTEQFDKILAEQIERTNNVLGSKAKEYATADRLHNFKVAADLQGCTPQEALGGMLAKHTVSIYDMIRSSQTFTRAQWDEKITDHINYLILLRAIVEEEISNTPTKEEWDAKMAGCDFDGDMLAE